MSTPWSTADIPAQAGRTAVVTGANSIDSDIGWTLKLFKLSVCSALLKFAQFSRALQLASFHPSVAPRSASVGSSEKLTTISFRLQYKYKRSFRSLRFQLHAKFYTHNGIFKISTPHAANLQVIGQLAR